MELVEINKDRIKDIPVYMVPFIQLGVVYREGTLTATQLNEVRLNGLHATISYPDRGRGNDARHFSSRR